MEKTLYRWNLPQAGGEQWGDKSLLEPTVKSSFHLNQFRQLTLGARKFLAAINPYSGEVIRKLVPDILNIATARNPVSFFWGRACHLLKQRDS